MARRRIRSGQFSLFPFLSILLCLMGILAFIMVSVAAFAGMNPIVTFATGGVGSKQVRIVECLADRVVLLPDRREVPVEDLEVDGSGYKELVEEVAKNRERQYFFFAIYPEGIHAFQEARRLAEQASIDIGFEPMLKGWRLQVQDLREQR